MSAILVAAALAFRANAGVMEPPGKLPPGTPAPLPAAAPLPAPPGSDQPLAPIEPPLASETLSEPGGYSDPQGAYERPIFRDTPLSREGGIALRPRPRSAAVRGSDTDKPVLRDLGRVWDVSRFETGRAPIELGELEDRSAFSEPRGINVLDLPIKMAGSEDDYRLPKELEPFREAIQRIIDAEHSLHPPGELAKYYAYLTIDQGFVEKGRYQRRPGLHVDGFQGKSIEPKTEVNHSYVVSNRTPTVYFTHPFDFSHLEDGRHDFFLEMDRQADEGRTLRTRPYRIYLMDGYSVHRAEKAARAGHRTFLRLSFEREVFDRKGNTHNPLFDYAWPMVEKRTAEAFTRYVPPAEKAEPPPKRRAVLDWLARDDVKGGDVIAWLSRRPELAQLFSRSTGVREGYTAEEHARRVYEAYEAQAPKFGWKKLRAREPIDFKAFVKLLVALHDIGKPLAHEAGDRHREHEFTMPIIEGELTRLGFRPMELELAAALVDLDVPGRLAQGRLSEDEAYALVVQSAGRLGMEPAELFRLQRFFFAIDAASYPSIRASAFKTVRGRLVPLSQAVADLEVRLESRKENAKIAAQVDAAIEREKRKGRLPVLAVDLDDTVFLHSSRLEHLLRRWDEEHGTSWFADTHYSEIPTNKVQGYLLPHLRRRLPERRARALTKEITDWVVEKRRDEDALLADRANPATLELLRRWTAAGAKIIWVTGRRRFHLDATRESLRRLGLPSDDVIQYGTRRRIDLKEFKARAIEQFLRENRLARMVAFLDDDPRNIRYMKRRFPWLFSIRILLDPRPSRRLIRTKLTLCCSPGSVPA
jgi:hypothetical protein